jgi:DNA-binding XRE family transcriptional regulator
VGVTAQTIVNLERRPDYNASLNLLRKVAAALSLEMSIHFTPKKEQTMSKTRQPIIMGNDEFILYIRKQHPDNQRNNQNLAKKVWRWLQRHDEHATKHTPRSIPCIWGDTAQNRGNQHLPTSATQFEFDRNLLPALYTMLDNISYQQGDDSDEDSDELGDY